MGGLTPHKKRNCSVKMSPKTLKCTVHMNIQAITCPGVVLPSEEDVYLSVCVMGQYRKTACLPPVFPLLFHHSMDFVKTFSGAIDPSDIADQLEADTTTFELIQIVPPVGEILATVEENTRDFLYPGPKLELRVGAPGREILMKKSISFPGISPKVEFTTTSIIQECDGRDIKRASPPCSPSPTTTSPSPLPKRRGKLDPGTNGICSSSGYLQPTVASRSRALSPYTHRRMCQLSEDAEQRLAFLRLGPHCFRKETDRRAPFVVPRSLSTSMVESASPRLSAPRLTHSLHPSRSESRAAEHGDSSLLGSYRPKSNRKSSRQEVSKTPLRGAPPPPVQSTPASSTLRPQALSSPSLKERFQNSPSSGEIHRRVQNILLTNQPDRKLSFDDEENEAQQVPCSSNSSLGSRLLKDSSWSQPRETSVHLDNGTYWSNQASLYSGKPHRAVFEDSLEKIYRNLYRQASCSEGERERRERQKERERDRRAVWLRDSK